jgi:1,4-dihydroxy-2-naphthoate octaprenyltransferase
MNSNKQRESSLAQLPTEDRKKTMKTNPLLILTAKGLKYFVLAVAGFAIAFVVFQVFGAFSLAKSLLSFDVLIWFVRVAVSLFCLFAIAMIFESWR